MMLSDNVGFHSKVPLDSTQEIREQSEQWPKHACTTTFTEIPKNVTSEKPITLMPTLIRWWEAMRAPGVDLDATDG